MDKLKKEIEFILMLLFISSCTNIATQSNTSTVNSHQDSTGNSSSNKMKIVLDSLQEGTYEEIREKSLDTSVILLLRLKKVSKNKYYYTIDCFDTSGYMVFHTNIYPINSGIFELDNFKSYYHFNSVVDSRVEKIDLASISKDTLALEIDTKFLGKRNMIFVLRKKNVFELFNYDAYRTKLCYLELNGKENVSINFYEYPDETSKMKKITLKNKEFVIFANDIYELGSHNYLYSLVYFKKNKKSQNYDYEDFDEHMWIKASDSKYFGVVDRRK